MPSSKCILQVFIKLSVAGSSFPPPPSLFRLFAAALFSPALLARPPDRLPRVGLAGVALVSSIFFLLFPYHNLYQNEAIMGAFIAGARRGGARERGHAPFFLSYHFR